MDTQTKHTIEKCESELKFTTSRSSGAGGQHVNKVETKVTLRWDVKTSVSLSTEEKAIISDKLSSYINKEGELILTDQSSRSQLKNKASVVRKWQRLIVKAFYVKKLRKKRKPTKAALAKRRKDKEKRSELKASRRWRID